MSRAPTIPFTPRIIVRGDPVNEFFSLETPVKRKHRFIIRYCEWTREYRAYSDSIGPESSPEGVGESPVEALELLIDELEELEKRSDPT